MIRIGRNLIPLALLAVFLAALIGLGFFLTGRELPPSPADFACFYLGSKALFQGQDAYSLNVVKSLALLDGYDGWVYPYLYPPHFAFVLLPFVLFPINVGAAQWTVASVLFLILALFLLCQGEEGMGLDVRLFLIAVILAAIGAPMVWTVILGQNSTFFLFFGALVLWALRSKRYALAGIALAATTTKPQIMLAFLILVLVMSFRQKLWRMLSTFTVLLALMGVVITVIRPDLIINWVKTVITRQAQGKEVLSSLVLFKQHLGETPGTIAFLVMAVLFLCLIVYLASRYSRSEGDTLSLTLGIGAPAMLLISPYYEPYDCTILLLAVLPATRLALRSRKLNAKAPLVVLWPGMFLFPSFLWAIPRTK